MLRNDTTQNYEDFSWALNFPVHCLHSSHFPLPKNIWKDGVWVCLDWPVGCTRLNFTWKVNYLVEIWDFFSAQWLRCYATNRKVAGSIPDGVIGIFHWNNPSDRTMALGSTQPQTEMSSRRISWWQMRPVRKADNLTTPLCRCHEIWEP